MTTQLMRKATRMELTIERYRDKLKGCWLGKNVGGTLGAPFEWKRQVNDVSFYTTDPGGSPIPNDDLDIQLLWLMALEKHGADYDVLDAKVLSRYFFHFVTPYWAEYGMAKVNLGRGLLPPFSGDFNNPYQGSCGSFIRAEIWACIAPGAPDLAMRFAYNDSIIDHAHGEGTVAALFVAAMESAAFVEEDMDTIIEAGLSRIPPGSGIARAVRLVRECRQEKMTWRDTRDRILESLRGYGVATSPEEKTRGFEDGPLGWDTPSNIGMLVTALLWGDGDLGTTVCTAVNCGEDTDCTAATAGALWGIIHGARAMPERWTKPIGERITTMCLDVGDFGLHGHILPGTVDELSARVEAICRQAALRYRLPVTFGDREITRSDLLPPVATVHTVDLESLHQDFHSSFLSVRVRFPDGYVLEGDKPLRVELDLVPRLMATNYVRATCHTGSEWQVSPSSETVLLLKDSFYRPGQAVKMALSVQPRARPAGVATMVIEFSLPGMPSMLLVPITLVSDVRADPRSTANP